MHWLCQWLSIGCVAGSLAGPAYTIDGDTISINYVHIRLYGIDAEELSEPNGLAAKQHMEQLTRGRIVTCTPTGERSYDRLVAVCGDLNERMVADGMALDCARYSHGLYRRLEPVGVRSRLIQKGYC